MSPNEARFMCHRSYSEGHKIDFLVLVFGEKGTPGSNDCQ